MKHQIYEASNANHKGNWVKGVANQLNRFDVERLRDKTAVGAAHFWELVFGVWGTMFSSKFAAIIHYFTLHTLSST